MGIHMNGVILMLVLSLCVNNIAADRVKAKIPKSMQHEKQNKSYHDQMERELSILKRQNPDMKYERPQYNGQQDAAQGKEQKMRLLKDKLNGNDSILKDLEMPLFDISGSNCEKTMNYNQDANHIYNNNISIEEKLKQVQQEIEETKSSSIKSNRDIVIDGINSSHSICYFGMTQAYNSVSYQNYNAYCSNKQNSIIFDNKQFQTHIRSAHIKLQSIQQKYHNNHLITCGVQPIEITHGQASSLTQYISYICFDPIQQNQYHTDL